MELAKTGPKTTPLSMLKLFKKEEEELPFSFLQEKAREELGITKRTAIKYLNSLVKEEILQKRVDEKRNTYYKIQNKPAFYKNQIYQEIEKTKDDELLVFTLIVIREIQEKGSFNVFESALEKYRELKKHQKGIIKTINGLEFEQRRKKLLS